MKILPCFSTIAVLAAFTGFTGAGVAGTLSVTSGPTLTPSSAFTNSTLQVQSSHNPPGVNGDVIRVTGGTTITPGAATSASVAVSGNFSAVSGDLGSMAYSFIIDSNYNGSIDFTLTGSATVQFLGTQNFTTSGTVTRGLNQYSGKVKTPSAFPASVSGTFSATLQLNFTPATSQQFARPSAATGAVDLRVDQFDFQLAPTETTPIAGSQPLNISTRLAVQTGDNTLIGGLIITGTTPKKVIIRGIGPSLGFAGVLQNPTLSLFQGQTLLASNDDWKENQAEVEATTIPPTDDRESAIVRSLNPGSYTAILSGKGGATGIGLVEVYDLEKENGRLANISTRGVVQTGNDVMIGGFILGPAATGSTRVVVRAIGPSLTAFGVPNALQNPIIELRDSNGATINTNDNWKDSPESQTISSLGLAPSDDRESALLAVPSPANYTAVVRGAGDSSGVGLVEVYHVP
jgi:hypothetical protein